MRIGGLIALVLMGVSLAACTIQDKAEVAADFYKPTGYTERAWLIGKPGYGDEEIDTDTQEIWFVGNSVTSRDRAKDMVVYHSAMVGRQRGATHFVLSDIKFTTTCIQPQTYESTVRATTEATYVSERPGAFEVESVLRMLEAKVLRSTSTSQERQKIFLANQASCYNQRAVRPEQVRTNLELEAESQTGKTESEKTGKSN
ncbi:MAG: hypothetical protein HEP70_09110 [Rhodobiaceae bacterium]|nr:hypothetical protein [Rhodobiaceae bacterium]